MLFNQPPYQKATLPNGMGRGVPDVSYNAAILHGVLVQLFIGQGGGTLLFGGTSCGAPQWAALTAIANQKAGHRLGFLNKAIYQIGKHIDHPNPAHPASFHDITSGNNSSGKFDSMGNPVIATGFTAGNGWDATTGVGSPMGPGLVDYLVKNVSPGDGQSAISTSKPKSHPKPVKPGRMKPH